MSHLPRRLASALAVLLLVLFASAGSAQIPGMMRPPGGGLPTLLLEPSVHTALALSAEQEAAWTALDAARQALYDASEASRTALRAAIDAQFASGAPDLLAIEEATAAARSVAAARVEALRAQAVALYTSLNTGQQAIAVSAAVAQHHHRQLMGPAH